MRPQRVSSLDENWLEGWKALCYTMGVDDSDSVTQAKKVCRTLCLRSMQGSQGALVFCLTKSYNSGVVQAAVSMSMSMSNL